MRSALRWRSIRGAVMMGQRIEARTASVPSHHTTRSKVPRRIVDLTQPLNRSTQVHPFFNPPQIVRELIHVDYAPDQPSFNAELIITSNHAATHVDAFGHYDRSPGAEAI